MTEPRYYGSTASLRELLESDAIDANSKANIRIELLHRESVCLPIKPEHVEALRSSLELARARLNLTRGDLLADESGKAALAQARQHLDELVIVIDSYMANRD
ncbi:hypothetical protein PBI_TEAMOCIL_8 [Microbacterium phage Teamocil]|uniref:Uncharacterized protein n=1 Tax=Microbacterium phage Teamocil TaxID=2656554 RepID=A0A649VWF1_9CAUD|nr:hypothetical protein QDA12_gp08 [Microbacterium phage Teamocil]QGJ88863.1 hypothetical protein PBI_GINA_8 [Microbacterium phage Gina]QGJ96960.1 hypothetical protein PBI_TEAMOCIL_8 [Microbacterium phage Teamocil]